MIEINLLPEGMRRYKRAYFKLDLEMSKIKFLALGVIAGVLILLMIIPSLGSFIRKRQIVNLLSKEKKIALQKSEIEAINNEIAVLKVKLTALDKVTRRRFLWAKKLDELSDLVLPGIWFTRIYTDTENRLMIEGMVISKKVEAMAIVGKFMKNIREHKSFFEDFSNIKLESVQRKDINGRDVVDFRIALYFLQVD